MLISLFLDRISKFALHEIQMILANVRQLEKGTSPVMATIAIPPIHSRSWPSFPIQCITHGFRLHRLAATFQSYPQGENFEKYIQSHRGRIYLTLSKYVSILQILNSTADQATSVLSIPIFVSSVRVSSSAKLCLISVFQSIIFLLTRVSFQLCF